VVFLLRALMRPPGGLHRAEQRDVDATDRSSTKADGRHGPGPGGAAAGAGRTAVDRAAEAPARLRVRNEASRITGGVSSPSTRGPGAACTRAASTAITRPRSAGRPARSPRTAGRSKRSYSGTTIRGRQDRRFTLYYDQAGMFTQSAAPPAACNGRRPASGTPPTGVPARRARRRELGGSALAVGRSPRRYRELAPDVWPRPSPSGVVVMRR